MLFLDMDGVFADFDTHHENVFGERPEKVKDNVDWNKIKAIPDYFLEMPMMPDAMELWDYVKPLRPTFLSGCPKSMADQAAANKRGWIDLNLGRAVPAIFCRSKEKFKQVIRGRGDVLIDDWTKYMHLWIEAGGSWITHTSAAESIKQLEALRLPRFAST